MTYSGSGDTDRAYPDVSVLLTVYDGDSAEHVDTALESIFQQTYDPSELVIVKDGPVGDDLDTVVELWADRYPTVVTVVALKENRGLGRALQVGLQHCSYELIARMDADDIAVPERLEMQVKYMTTNPIVDVVGGYVAEFTGSPENVSGIRRVPESPGKIATYARRRCPLNHPTVMFRKDAIVSVGGYSDRRSMQDYELWMRLLSEGYTLANLPEVLVKARAGSDLYARRGGLEYARTEFRLQQQFLQQGNIGLLTFSTNVLIRIPMRLAPRSLRGFIYSKILRTDG